MEEEEELFRVALFNGKHYNNWKFRLEIVLDENNLLIYIQKGISEIIDFVQDGDGAANIIEVHQKNYKKSMIIWRIANSHLEYVKDKASSYSVMIALKATFERKNVATQLYLQRKLLKGNVKIITN